MRVKNHALTRIVAERYGFRRIVLYTEEGVGSCPLACAYCFLQKDKPNQTMSVETLRRAIDFVREYAAPPGPERNAVHFFGTEPLKRWDLIVEAATYAPEFEYTITTNAYLLDERKIRQMKELGNVRVVLLSIDGDEWHNRYRVTPSGENSTARVVANAKKYVEIMGPEFTLRGTVAGSDPDLVSRYKFLETIGARGIDILPVTQSPWDESEAARMWIELGEYYGWSLNTPSGMMNRLLERMQGRPTEPPGNLCKVGYHQWNISPDGRINICHGFQEDDEMILGNLWDGITNVEPLVAIAEEVERFHTPENPYPKEECKTCHAYNYCMGINWCAAEFYDAGRHELGERAAVTPTDGYCNHLRGMVTAAAYWLSKAKEQESAEQVRDILQAAVDGLVEIRGEGDG